MSEASNESTVLARSINKSAVTNLICLLLVGFGVWQQEKFPQLLNMGLYGLSGAVTNWLAIYMLFERVPGLYGSGIIPNRFEEFKSGIRNLIMTQFFHEEHIKRFLDEQVTKQSSKDSFDLTPILEAVDYDHLFAAILAAVRESQFGAMLQMFGGETALEPLKEPFKEKARSSLEELLHLPETRAAIANLISKNFDAHSMIQNVEHIVEARLEELTPKLVKQIIQDMIREHLGWLVVWGGFFGALIGFVASYL